MKTSSKFVLACVSAVLLIVVAAAPAQATNPRSLPAGDTMYIFGCKVNGTNPPGVGQLSDTGVITQLAAFPSAPYDTSCFQGAAFDPTTGLIYVIQVSGQTSSLWTFNPSTNVFTISPTADISACKPINLAIDSQGNAYAQTNYLGSSANSLVSINLTTGACSARIGSAFTTSIGSGFQDFGGFSFNLTDDLLYATDYDSGNFYSINTSTGAVTPFANSTFGSQTSIGGIAFDSTGMTWISFGDRPNRLKSSPWATYNTDNTLQGYFDFNSASVYMYGIAIIPAGSTPPAPAPAPQPTPVLAETGVNTLPYLASGFILIALGMGLIIARRKKKN